MLRPQHCSCAPTPEPGLPSPQQTVVDARGDPDRVLLEGVHALKHAVRFGARLTRVLTPDRDRLGALLDELAPDVAAELSTGPEQVRAGTWEALTAGGLPSPALAVAERPRAGVDDVLAVDGRVLLLERVTHLGNLGAAVRVAAAAGLRGVLTIGEADPWHPRAVRGAAGLQFAVTVGRADGLPPLDRRLVALDPAGGEPGAGAHPPRAALAFGAERHGLSAGLLARADDRVAIPMRAGVSSLNLATAVAVVVYRRGRPG